MGALIARRGADLEATEPTTIEPTTIEPTTTVDATPGRGAPALVHESEKPWDS